MGKASSNKKVQRAAKAGSGARARSAGERNFLFPAALALVVILGMVLVIYARNERVAEAQDPPIALEDHWHSAFGIYICDGYEPTMPQFEAANNGGTHTHGDGLIHIHPFSEARSGSNATMTNFMDDAPGYSLSDDRLEVPGRDAITNDTQCEGAESSSLRILYWPRAVDALAGGDPIVITSDFDELRFIDDGQVFVIVYAEDDFIPDLPPSMSALEGVGSDLGVSEVPTGSDYDGDGVDDNEQTEVTPSTVVTEDDTSEEDAGDDTADDDTSTDDEATDEDAGDADETTETTVESDG